MTWVRLDDQFADHPKVVGLSAAAFRLHITALCYAARQETDGAVPRRAPFVVKRAATELVVAGLWEEQPDGWLIHDYLDFNPSHAELDSKRDSKRIAGAIGAASRWHGRVNAPVPDPYPTRIPDPAPDARARDDRRRDYIAIENLTGHLNFTVASSIDEFRADHPAVSEEWVEAACEEAAANNVRSWRYVEAILKRWEQDGFKADKRPPTGRKAAEPEADYSRGVNTGAGLVVMTLEQEFAAERARNKQEAG